jgi:hypothetical protein
MADLHDQLRAYGRQIERDLDDRPPPSDAPKDSGPPARPPRSLRHHPWLLVAAVTAAVAVIAAVLPTALRSEEDDMRRGYGSVFGLCLLAAACSSTPDTASTTGPPSPTASVAATTSAASPTGPQSLLDGPAAIEPGTYVVDQFGTPIEVTMPAGWERKFDISVQGPDESVIAFLDVASVYTESCNWIDKEVPVGPTVDELVQALQAQQNTTVSEPRPLTIDGFTGVELTLSPAASSTKSTCYGGQNAVFQDADGRLADLSYAGPMTVWILDLAGRRAVVTSYAYQPMSAATQDQMAAILDSVRIG